MNDRLKLLYRQQMHAASVHCSFFFSFFFLSIHPSWVENKRSFRKLSIYHRDFSIIAQMKVRKLCKKNSFRDSNTKHLGPILQTRKYMCVKFNRFVIYAFSCWSNIYDAIHGDLLPLMPIIPAQHSAHLQILCSFWICKWFIHVVKRTKTEKEEEGKGNNSQNVDQSIRFEIENRKDVWFVNIDVAGWMERNATLYLRFEMLLSLHVSFICLLHSSLFFFVRSFLMLRSFFAILFLVSLRSF